MIKLQSSSKRAFRAFAITEILLSVTTATTAIGTVLTAVTIYMSVADRHASITTPDGPALVLPADGLTMDATLFHLELQDIIHQADLSYVIGGRRYIPGSEGHSTFMFEPTAVEGSFTHLDCLEELANVPERALSSYVVTQLLRDQHTEAFTEENESSYRQHEFTIVAARSNLELTALVSLQINAQGPHIILNSTIFRDSGVAGWSKGTAYRCAINKAIFESKASLLSLGADHYWVHHDRIDPQSNPTANNSVWNRYDEGFCRVEFPDPMWNLELQPDQTSLNSKYTYFLQVAR